MRDRTKLFNFTLCALLMLGFASAAQAAGVRFDTSFTNKEVIEYGQTELVGAITLTVDDQAGAGYTTLASTITILYPGATIKNTLAAGTAINAAQAGGIELTGDGAFVAGNVTYTSSNAAAGGKVVITIIKDIDADTDDVMTLDGVRLDVSGSSTGVNYTAKITSSPSASNHFDINTGDVAEVTEGFTMTTTGVSDPICRTPLIPTITITEGFAAAFFDSDATANNRDAFGATGSTTIKITVSNLPAGVSLSWPLLIMDSAAGRAIGNDGDGQLDRTSVSGTGNSTVIYTYNTADHATSDIVAEVFIIDEINQANRVDDLNVTISTASAIGTATVQAELGPSATLIPRFNATPTPTNGDAFLIVTNCMTNILFPYVANIDGYDTGLAVANTSYDQDAISDTTTPQTGAMVLYLYKSFEEGEDVEEPATYTVSAVSAGNTWAGTMSTIPAFAGSTGYIIAVAQFQYAHGYAFITYSDADGLRLAQGYVGNIIPDTAFTSDVRAASPSVTSGSGEGLGQ